MIGQPVPGYSWRPPGSSFSAGHQAVDIPAPCGTPVVAVADGVVRSVGDDGAAPYELDFSANLPGGQGGLMVTVTHRAVPTGGRGAPAEVIAQYAHLSRTAVQVGQGVRAGQQLGAVGATGTATGCHLHFGFRVGGVWRDYREFLAGGRLASTRIESPGGGKAMLPAGYGSGPVQPAPKDPAGHPVGAFPLDEGKTCPPGYRPGSVSPGLLGGIFGGTAWLNRKTFSDGTVMACIRNDLDPGDPANQSAQDLIGGALGVLGDVARNGAFLVGFLVLGLLGVWILLRGRGSGGAGVSVG